MCQCHKANVERNKLSHVPDDCFLQKENSEQEFISQFVYAEAFSGSTPMEERRSRIEKWEKLSYKAN